ncbi:MAG: hypothetical protein NVSMB6_17720 [Burkholderiaceae bacterium]
MQSRDAGLIYLTDLAGELAAQAVNPAVLPGYRAIHLALLDGRVASERLGTRRAIRRTDLPKLAETFGLQLRSFAA